MAKHPKARAFSRGLVLTLSAVTLSAFAAAPSALAANSHANSHASDKSTTTSNTAQPVSNADQNSGGANGQCPSGPYCSTRNGSPSGNGNGGGQATGKPCAGCVGKADNKNPKGQMPNGNDNNAGYECDRNHGIGRSNPAHTGCTTGGTSDCTTNPTAAGCTSGGSDCTTNPTAAGCTSGGSDCTTNPTAAGCTSGGETCTTLPDLPQCVTLGHDCTAIMSNATCKPSTSVLGEKVTRTPTRTSTSVLGEAVTRTPSGALPFTGANIALMTAIALMTLAIGTALAVSARRRTSTTS